MSLSCCRRKLLAIIISYVGILAHFFHAQNRIFLSTPSPHQSGGFPSSLKPSLETIPLDNGYLYFSSGISDIDDQELTTGPSVLPSEVKSITHVPNEAKVIVKFKSGSELDNNGTRSCANPYLFGRLSGPFISHITKWEKVHTNDTDNRAIVDEIIAYYNAPMPGRYYIEIIAILCNDLEYAMSFKDVCLEDPARHRITHVSASINVLRTAANDNTKGFWKWSSNSTSFLEPLLTRYQPLGCRTQYEQTEIRCFVPMSLERFEPYEFVYVNTTGGILKSTTVLEEEKPTMQQAFRAHNDALEELNLCFVGGSHSREMAREVNLWLQKWNTTNIVALYLEALFPWRVDHNFIRKSIKGKKCFKTIIAAGQWPAGKKPPKLKHLDPTTFPDFYTDMKDMIERLKSSETTGVYLRSIHYNSLGDIKITCPPIDWRSPPVIERYNDVVSNLSESMDVPLIDTNFIIQPMWDSAGDFSHYRNDKVASAEALFMLGRLLQS